eukprot:2005302-Pyramimonas_sp.AAC.1
MAQQGLSNPMASTLPTAPTCTGAAPDPPPTTVGFGAKTFTSFFSLTSWLAPSSTFLIGSGAYPKMVAHFSLSEIFS